MRRYMRKVFILDSSVLLLITEKKINVIEYIIDNFGTKNMEIILPNVVEKELINMKNKPGKLILNIIGEYIQKGIVKRVKDTSLPRTKFADLWIIEYVKAKKEAIKNGELSIYVCTTDTLLRNLSKQLGAKTIILKGKSILGIY